MAKTSPECFIPSSSNLATNVATELMLTPKTDNQVVSWETSTCKDRGLDRDRD
jgi:hypothetical protein